MSRNGGYFKDLGNFSQQFINQIASDIRSNAESLVNSAFQNEACVGPPPGTSASSRRTSRADTSSSSSASSTRPPEGQGVGPVPSSTSSSQATTPDEIAGDWLHHFVRGGGGGGTSSTATGSSSSMGNSGFCRSKHTSTVKPSDSQDSAMLCDICQAKFTLFNRRKLCSECKAYFCGSCVSREVPNGHPPQQRLSQIKTCKRCKVLLSNPPVRADLMELRVKDLQRYLISKKVNTKSCVEKKDLVELVIRQNGKGEAPEANESEPASSGPTQGDTSQSNQRRAPQERQKSFPKAYVESTHRHEWMEKMESGQEQGQEDQEEAEQQQEAASIQLNCEENDEDFIVVTSIQPLTPDHEEEQNETVTEQKQTKPEAAEETPVEPINIDQEDDEEMQSKAESEEEAVPQGAEALVSDNEEDVKEEASEACDDSAVAKSEPVKIQNSNLDLPEAADASSMSGSPRRFANQGLVYLSEIQTLEDVNELSVKQAKDILAMNRVNFKGVVEKDELLKHVTRLWRQEKQAQEAKESMNDSDLCKICMDDPVDCVMLECGHMCTCTTCGKQMAECPICRQYVVRVVRTFRA